MEFFYAHRTSRHGLRSSCRDCTAEYTRGRRDQRRKYLVENRDRIAAQKKAYNENHRELRAAISRKYRASHQEAVRSWRSRNPEGARAIKHRRRAREARVNGSHTGADELAQKSRQKDRCFYCGCKLTEWHVEHVTPLALGGSNGPENIVIACPRCNLSKGAKHPMEFAGIML